MRFEVVSKDPIENATVPVLSLVHENFEMLLSSLINTKNATILLSISYEKLFAL